jgi:Bacterial Ig-like domain
MRRALIVLAGSLIVPLIATRCQKPDTTPPTVTSMWPSNGATGVALDARPQIIFSEPMDQSATEAAFRIQPAIVGTFSWGGNTLTFQPDRNLGPESTCAVSVDTSALDLAGNALASRCTFSFSTGDSSARSTRVHMMGRSVMAGWFSHWGAETCAHGRFTLIHHVLESPPDIVASACAIVDGIPADENPIVFFKLCFVDFEGGDSATAQANLDRNLDYVTQVYDSVVTGHGLRLIVGNALPQVSGATNDWLVWNHRQYNQRLLQFAAAHPRVRIFDFYSVLSNAGGALKPEYATSSEDSHPNDLGYSALDPWFFSFLEE